MATDFAEAKLTERQLSVVRGVVYRKSIKKIAAEMDLSPSTVNEHLAAAKRRLDVTSTDKLVELYLEKWHGISARTTDTGMENRVEGLRDVGQAGSQDDSGIYLMADAFSLAAPEQMSSLREPYIVPEELDGRNAGLPRLIMIAKLIGLIFSALVLAILALQSVSGLMDR